MYLITNLNLSYRLLAYNRCSWCRPREIAADAEYFASIPCDSPRNCIKQGTLPDEVISNHVFIFSHVWHHSNLCLSASIIHDEDVSLMLLSAHFPKQIIRDEQRCKYRRADFPLFIYH